MGPFLFSITFLIMFPAIVTVVVEEKHARIRIMMRMMGLGDAAYWSITFLFWFLLYFGFSLVFMLFVNAVALPSSGYRLGMFANVLGGVQFVFLLLYATTTISFAFLWGTLIGSVRTAQVCLPRISRHACFDAHSCDADHPPSRCAMHESDTLKSGEHHLVAHPHDSFAVCPRHSGADFHQLGMEL
jgi:hypothetical protein